MGVRLWRSKLKDFSSIRYGVATFLSLIDKISCWSSSNVALKLLSFLSFHLVFLNCISEEERTK